MTKPELRKYYTEQRLALSVSEVAEGSEAIARLFFEYFKIEKIGAIHCYLPLKKKQEIGTFQIIHTIQEQLPQTNVIVPRVVPNSNELEHYLWKPDIKLDLNKWGILEPNPEANNLFPISEIELVIVPLLAYDTKGNRVGYGKGYYDQFLKKCKPNTIKVGLSFFEPVEEIIDTEPFDIPLNYCITPKKIWGF